MDGAALAHVADERQRGGLVSEFRVPEQLAVPVRGGDLAVLHWPADTPGAPVVVLVHGITGNGLSWARVAGALGHDVEVFAPDLRGRAGSAALPGPWGMAAHAEDVLALLDAVRAPQAVLVGHSMGGFVVAVAAAGVARERVRGVVMVDGGLPFPDPPGADVQAKLASVLGPALDRLALTWPDLAAVRAFWSQHPAVGPWVDVPSVAAYLARDVVATDGGLRSACVPEAIRADGGQFLTDAAVLEATAHLGVPATLLWAPRGLLDQTPGLYDDERLAAMGRSGVTARQVPDSNHYSILWAEQGVTAVRDAVRAAALG
jgi:pimeloyl-ACP methyl ester carboxylesterase